MQRLERLRTDVPAFVKKVIDDLYEPVAAAEVVLSASTSSPAADELDLDDIPSKKEVERLQQVRCRLAR